jgi:hypothetical protein
MVTETARRWRVTRYERGRQLEYRVRDALLEANFFVVRSAGSKGCVDLVALPRVDASRYWAPRSTLLVQCKIGGVLPPGEWNDLVREAYSVRAVPVMARWSPRQPLEFWILDGFKEAGVRRQPMTRLSLDLDTDTVDVSSS